MSLDGVTLSHIRRLESENATLRAEVERLDEVKRSAFALLARSDLPVTDESRAVYKAIDEASRRMDDRGWLVLIAEHAAAMADSEPGIVAEGEPGE